MGEPLLVYFSTQSLNTHRFVEKLGMRAVRIPLSPQSTPIEIHEEFILMTPTYAGDDGRGAVPKQVITFLNTPRHRELIQGVIASGNRNFGKYYGYAGTVISKKCEVPFLYRFELMGTPEDIENVRNGLRAFWKSRKSAKTLSLV